jgi:hypothetical protein
VTLPLFLPLPPTDASQVPDYLRRLNVAIQAFSAQIDAAIAAVDELQLTNLDGGCPSSTYGATNPIDGGGVT